ncbi:MAG: DUF2341 domain-containing protein [Candidatus Pacebacteria bacterium]|nr:DUF2341 domain-containing protein [Candidatus Paceibacterota bacterium]
MKNKHLKIVRLVLSCVFFIFFVLSSDLSSAAFNVSDFDYRREISVSENSGSNLIDYQILVSLDTQSLISSGKMRSDCGDVRFIDSTLSNELSYWIESGCNTSSTKIWVKVLSLAASSNSTVYTYYGNSAATSASSGSGTFVMYDGFDSNSGWSVARNLDITCTSDWDKRGYIIGSGIYSTGSSSAPLSEDIHGRSGGALVIYANCGDDYAVSKNIGVSGSSYKVTFYYSTPHPVYYHDINPTSQAHYYYGFGGSYTEMPNTGSYYNWTRREIAPTSPTIQFRAYDGDGVEVNSVRTYVDDLLVRKYVSNEPSVSLDPEEPTSVCNDGIKTGAEVCDRYDGCASGEICNSGCSACECAITCSTEGFECGTHELCGISMSCGSCSAGSCIAGLCVDNCGNGVVDSGEACDGSLGCASGETCNPGCNACECLSSCSVSGYTCGDYTFCGIGVSCGTCFSGQHCEGGSCAGDYCGDGVVSGSEVCDPDNRESCPVNGEICSSNCSGCVEKIKYFDTDVGEAINELVLTLLRYAGGLAFLLLVAAGVYYMAVGNNPEMQTRAKKMITYILMGLVIIMISYAILVAIEDVAV